ncbi:MAG: ABC transporter ATP-binding protein [Gemmatimonadetes bacterium]|nr:ABC transporter ATP-binding protein [Gemmatimonadota bacterium]
MFEATELSFTYPSGRRGLGSVSLRGEPGDRVVVMGPNGSGKSTLLRLVSTELRSRPGSLKLFGEPCEPLSRDLRRRIGIVQDTPVHVDELTGMENGLLFAELYGLLRADAAGALETLFTSLGLDDALDVPTREYSYGMKKKLLIAEALVHEPELLILDEPALGLDPPSRAALLRILEERSGNGVCMLAATNDPALAQELATTVVLLHEGEVVAHGSPAELLAQVGGATRIEVYVAGPPPVGPRSGSHLATPQPPAGRPSAPRRRSRHWPGYRQRSCRSNNCRGALSPRANRVQTFSLNWLVRSSLRV